MVRKVLISLNILFSILFLVCFWIGIIQMLEIDWYGYTDIQSLGLGIIGTLGTIYELNFFNKQFIK